MSKAINLFIIFIEPQTFNHSNYYFFIEEGEKNKAIKIAKSLINLGLDKESIAKSTGLDLCEVEKLMN